MTFNSSVSSCLHIAEFNPFVSLAIVKCFQLFFLDMMKITAINILLAKSLYSYAFLGKHLIKIRMGNICKPMAVSFQCMTKSTTIKQKIIKKEKK